MTLECPKCKSPVARQGQRFCYRCGQELDAYYDSLNIKIPASEPVGPDSKPEPPPSKTPRIPVSTVILDPHAFDEKEPASQTTPRKAMLRILLPTGDVFDRPLNEDDTQIGKGPRNDIVMADAAVSAAHAIIHIEGETYTITDIGSRNGTFVNGERVSAARKLNHGDVISMGLSKLTFRFADYDDTSAIETDKMLSSGKQSVPALTQESVATAVINAGLASKEDVDRVSKDGDRRIVRALVSEGLVSEESLCELMSRTFEIPRVDLDATEFDETLVNDFPPRLAIELQVFPLSKDAEGLTLAVSDPTDAESLARASAEVGSTIRVRLATAEKIRRQVDRCYGPKLIGILPNGETFERQIDQHEIAIGKATHNQIVLSDPTVSNTHGILIARGGGYSIADLGSRNGTFVNGERLGSQARTLRHGDKILVGKTVLTFRNLGETAANITAVLSASALEEAKQRATTADSQHSPAAVEASASASSSDPSSAAVWPSGGESSDAVPASASSDGAAKEDKKKKKKKKKKEKDARLRAAYISAGGRIFAAVLSVALTVALTLYLTRLGSTPNKDEIKISKKGHAKLKLPKPGAGTPIQGGSYESSAVIQVPGTDGVLFVDDKQLDSIFWMEIDESGKQKGDIQAIPLGANVGDMEGITYGDGYFYAAGSQSDPNYGDQNAIARFKFDAGSRTISDTQVMSGLRDFLLTNVAELKGEGEKKGKDGGLNIEGLSWDPKRSRLLLGLRSPQLNGNAMIIPIALQNAGGPFSISNLKLAEPHPIQLSLEGLGIRDIQFDSQLDSFLLISGAPEHHEKKFGFKLWQWNGEAVSSTSDSGLRALTDLDQQMKPEGVTHFEFGGHEFIFIVGDASAYLKIDYIEAE
jgi:pSer/pThr/pTyr-binding forkhead associated (FHA) protein